MSTLPRMWKRTTLGEVAEFIMGQAPAGTDCNTEGRGTVFVKAGEFGEVYPRIEAWTTRPLKFSQEGDVLICVVGATCGKLNLAINSAIGRSVAAIRPSRVLETKFLYLQMQPKVLELRASSTGSAQGVHTRGDLGRIDLVIPPLPEQRRIVAEIEKQFTRLEAGVAALRRVQANLKRYRAAVLKAACEGTLVENEVRLAKAEGRSVETGEQLLQRILASRRAAALSRRSERGGGKYKEPAAPDLPAVALAKGDTANLPPLPEGWTWATVEQLNMPNRPCAYGVLQPGADIVGGVPFVRVGDIHGGKVDQTNLKRISPAIAAQYPRTKLHGGESAITLVGAIGRTAIIPESLAGGNTARAVGIVPLSSEVNSRWVEMWFRNPRKTAEMISKSHEVARKTLNLEDVRSAAVALSARGVIDGGAIGLDDGAG